MDVSALTVAPDSIMLKDTTDATEGRDAAIVDTPGEFLSAPLTEVEIFHMVFQGRMVEFIVKMDPKLYGQYTVKGPNG